MYKRILVYIDGSEQSYKALDHAVAIAEKFGSDLILLTVVPIKTTTFFPDDGAGITTSIDIINYKKRMIAKYQDILTKTEARIRLEHTDLKVSTILRDGRPSANIVDVANNDGYDLIVMGSRGKGGIKGWILGSTSSMVVNSCINPVIIINYLPLNAISRT